MSTLQTFLGQIISLVFGFVFIYIAISSYKQLRLLNELQNEAVNKERKGQAISANFLLNLEDQHQNYRGPLGMLRNKLLFLLLLPALLYALIIIVLLSTMILQTYLGFFFFLIFGSIIFFLLNDSFLVGWKYVMFLSENIEKATYDDLKYIRIIKEVLFESVMKYLIVGILVGLSALVAVQISYALALVVALYGSLFFELATNVNVILAFLILLILPTVGVYFILKLLKKGYEFAKQVIAKRFGIELNSSEEKRYLAFLD
ncbi:MAG: hypothetical protein ACP6IU_03805 [Candidatus Asgardarchaeia archaeon]